MVMCSKCRKRVAVVFVTKIENGNKVNDGLCIRCAKEMGIPVDNMLGNVMNQYGISSDDLESMEENLSMALTPSENDDMEDGGAPAIDLPKLFGDAGFPMGGTPEGPFNKEVKKENGKSEKGKKYKFSARSKFGLTL